ncbi:MAG: GNAT family N-acetyltransferase [Atopobiaceae bacterium]|jgi:RimJ/RimL family protein N-acetyltransferase|nr:GNAT family N-acetyltransferase [Atopobiaceae bacterium]
MADGQRIETERLILRPWREGDAKALRARAGDPGAQAKAGWLPHTSDEDGLAAAREAPAAPEAYAVTVKSRPLADEPVGSISLRIGAASDLGIPATEGEVGYWMAKPFWGYGYMPEAVIALIRHAFANLGLEAVWCGWDEGNEQSREVQETAGFRSHHTRRRKAAAGDEMTEHVTCITRDQWERGQDKDPTDSSTIDRQQREAADINEHVPRIARIRSGGQTGADRGGLDAAREAGIPICGWCPKDGLAEDMAEPPGLLRDYPELVESPSEGYVQRTAWNVRDAHATLIVAPDGLEPKSGTAMTVVFAHAYGRPVFVAKNSGQMGEIEGWLSRLGRGLTLNVAGPRASKLPEVYGITKDVVGRLLERSANGE